MCNFKVNILEYRTNTKKEIRHILEYFKSLMCLKDTEDTGIEKQTSEEMEKTVDCPLCLEPLEFDDKNFYPCTCGYQVCRFCWHRIRTNENGLCPACRRIYSENPANFQPLTPEEMQKVRHQKKMNNIQKKQKSADNRKQLANIRVIQKNLVFGVGFPLELSQDAEKKEKVLQMFRQFGQTQKETITDRTSYAGSQGPSACVYITYIKPEDAVRAVKSLTNTKVENRTIKVSLGTTKYCSNFLKNCQCPKGDCLYLHDLADEEASFTKEDIHLGKHLEYEQKLLEQTLNSIAQNKALSPNNESNRTNLNRNADDCSESSDDLHQNNSFYDSSEASELSPSSNSQNIENLRNIGSDLNNEIENNHQNIHSANLDVRCNIESSPKPVFRSEETIIINNHSTNSSVQENSYSPNYLSHQNPVLLKETESIIPQPNFLNNQIYESALQCRGQSSNSKESAFLRLINESGARNSLPEINNMNRTRVDRGSRMRDDDPDLGFDPCQESLNALEALLISEKRAKENTINRIRFNTLNTSPLSNSRSSVDPFDAMRNAASQSLKSREPPPGFTNNCTQNIHYKPLYESGSLNKTPIAMPNQLGARTNYGVQRFTQPAMPTNNLYLPDFTSTLSREIPDIIPPVLQQQHQQQQQQQQHQQQQQQQNQQRLMNLSQLQYSLPEQRSNTPLWNNPSQSHWRPMENLLFNQGITENRATSDFSFRMPPVRSNELTMRQWQQLPGNVNSSPFQGIINQEIPQLNHEQAKIQAMYKLEASRNSPSFGHRLQYTKKL